MEDLIKEKDLADKIGINVRSILEARKKGVLDDFYIFNSGDFYYCLARFDEVKNLLTSDCKQCKAKFVKTSPGASFCSEKCRVKFRTRKCKSCEKSFLITRGDYKRQFCSVACSTKYATLKPKYKICKYCFGEFYGSGRKKFCCKVCWRLDYEERQRRADGLD